jgi:hypothetical protein
MNTYTDEEKEYHTDIITDAIDFVEKRKQSFEIPIEEHIDLLLSYNEYKEMLRGTESIVNKEEYDKLYEQTTNIVTYLISTYRRTSELNLEYYYMFCKTIDKMMKIIAEDTSEEEDISNMFQMLKM